MGVVVVGVVAYGLRLLDWMFTWIVNTLSVSYLFIFDTSLD